MSGNVINKNCNSCKYGLFGRCKALEENKEYQEILKDRKDILWEKGFEFKKNFICDEYKSRYIEYPIEVSKINTDINISSFYKKDIGKFAKIRPCAEEYQNKTYLGLFLGELPAGIHISHDPDNKELNAMYRSNPAIFVFELNKIIYGMESWWGIIKNENELKEITDLDIDNVWYVKVLKSLCKED